MSDLTGHLGDLRRRDLPGLALLAGGLLPPTDPDHLKVAWQDRLDHFDPYRSPLRTSLMLARELFDGLLDRDPETFRLTPLLASSWRQEDDLTLAFQLRQNISFHDGSPFGAEDVVATVRTVLADPELAIPSNYAWLAGAQAHGDEVRLRLAHPFPAAAEFVSMVLPILPRDIASTGRRAELAKAPNGTGPYRFAGNDADGTLHLAAFAPDTGTPPKGRPAIRTLTIRQYSSVAGPFADLVTGRADWMWQLPPAMAQALAGRAEIAVLRADSMRVFYLTMDAAGRAADGGAFTHPDVRRAVCHAIDRDALAAGAGARVAVAPCAPTQFACDAAAAVRYAHDPDTARALLAGAGFPGGLDTELVSYVRPDVAAAIAGDLTAVGIRARVKTLPAAEALALAADGSAPLFLGSWGSSSINDISAFLPPFFDFGPLDMSRDAAVAALIADAGLTVDPEQRRGLYQKAIQRITEQAFFLPLFLDPAVYGVNRRLNFRPMPDELPRFYRMAWK